MRYKVLVTFRKKKKIIDKTIIVEKAKLHKKGLASILGVTPNRLRWEVLEEVEG